jgi:hypothetical protein
MYHLLLWNELHNHLYLTTKQQGQNMKNVETLLQILDEGAFITSEEMAELAKEVRALQRDAERYKWLNKYTAHLFMVTEKGLDAQMDVAMGKRNETQDT